MRSVTYSMGVSLDGYIVGPDGGFDWTAPDEEVFRFVTDRLIGLPADIANLTHLATSYLLFWPAAIGYRRFYQGILVRHRLTRRVAYGTVKKAPAGEPGSDIGAFETASAARQAGVPSFVVTTVDDHDDGVASAEDCTLREAVRTANEIPFTASTAP